jgi:hypothetical protein
MTRSARLPCPGTAALGAALLAVTAGGWLGAVAGWGGSAAGADPITACTPSRGTVVAVDFGHWAGPVVRACGVDDASAYELLHDGGFTTTGTQHDGPGFVCRIGSGAFRSGTQYPTPPQDPCVNTPPASAYWTFWVAEPGQNGWTYGRVGAVSYQPQPGEVEVWRFGATPTDGSSGAPPYSPATLRAAPVTTRTTPPPPPPHPPASTRAAVPVPPPSSGTSPATRNTTGAGQPTRTPSAARSSAASPPADKITSSTDPVVVAASPAAARPAAGSPTPALLGAAAVAVLAAGAGGLAWRRRGQRG